MSHDLGWRVSVGEESRDQPFGLGSERQRLAARR
jgi:hypothetical protein